MRDVMRQRFMWWLGAAFALATVSYFIQSADVPQIRRLISLASLLCAVIGLTLWVRWGRRVGRL